MKFVALISRPQEREQLLTNFPQHRFVFATLGRGGNEMLSMSGKAREASLEILRKQHRSEPFSGVLNSREKFVRLRHHIERHLGLPSTVLDPELLRDKWLQKNCLCPDQNGKASLLLSTQRDLERIPQDFFPAVLKPRFGFNSRSVVIVKSAKQLNRAYRRNQRFFMLMKNEDYSGGDFVLERYCPGSEHTLECFIQNGQLRCALISDKEPMIPPYCIESGDLMPTGLAPEKQQLLRDSAKQAVERLGIRHGWAHIEIKLDGDRSEVIEAAGRMGGGYFGEMIHEVYGIDRMAVMIDGLLKPDLSIEYTPRTQIKGRRLLAWGIAFLWRPPKIQDSISSDPSFRLIWPEPNSKIRRWILGPPFGYKNTILEYFCIHPDPMRIQQIADEFQSHLKASYWRIPNVFGRLIWRLLSLSSGQGSRWKLDV